MSSQVGLYPNRIQAVLQEGRAAVGMVVMEFATRGIARVLAYAGLDYAQIDMEHSGFTLDRVADLIAWFRATPLSTIVRVPQNLAGLIPGILDAGATAVQVADVETPEQARALVDEAKYAPVGKRGLGIVAAHTDFKSPKIADYVLEANRATMLFVGIESAEGIKNAEAIAGIEGVDGLAVGVSDLSHSMGIHGSMDDPRMKAALVSVAESCKRHGKIGKLSVWGKPQPREYLEMGYRVFGLRTDVTLFRDTVKSDAEQLRTLLQ